MNNDADLVDLDLEAFLPIQAEAFADLAVQAAVLDGDGRIVLVNNIWRYHFLKYRIEGMHAYLLGAEYRSLCRDHWIVDPGESARIERCISDVLDHSTKRAHARFSMGPAGGEGQYTVSVAALKKAGGAVVIHTHTGMVRQPLKAVYPEKRQASRQEMLPLKSLAHDLKNMLTVVVGNQELALEATDSSMEGRKYVLDGLRAARQAVQFCTEMMAADPTDLSEPVNLNKLVEETIAFCKPTVPDEVSVVFKPEASIPLTRGETANLKNAIMNVLINAVQACEDHGEIEVRTAVAQCEQSEFSGCIGQERMRDGHYLYVEISDTGPGVPQPVEDQIFELYVSESSAGMGIGLPSALATVNAHGGTIELIKEPDTGACFRIWLPVVSSF